MDKSNDYSLKYLVKKFLKTDLYEIESDETEEYMVNSKLIEELIKQNENDAKLTLDLMMKLQLVPLTKQLTNTGGNTWIRSL